MSSSYLYSIVIPHFNSKGKLKRLLKSIPVRQDIQVIVIDDLSTEKSILSIVDDPDFRHIQFILSDRKLTAGGARNLGIKYTEGKFLLFADSDDYFDTKAFDTFDVYCSSHVDLIQFKVRSFDEDSHMAGTRHLYLEKQYKLFGLTRYLEIPTPYAKLIRRELITSHNICFSEVAAGNDLFFSAHVALVAQNPTFDPSIVYAVSQNTDSITANETSHTTAIRILEHAKKVKLVRELTPLWFWGVYLARRNILDMTKEHLSRPIQHQSELEPELIEASKAYDREIPAWVKKLSSLLKTVTRS